MNDLYPYLRAANNSPILFIINDIEPTVLQNLINAKLMAQSRANEEGYNFNIMLVEHDGFGDRKTEIMNDIGAMTGATRATCELAGIMG